MLKIKEITEIKKHDIFNKFNGNKFLIIGFVSNTNELLSVGLYNEQLFLNQLVNYNENGIIFNDNNFILFEVSKYGNKSNQLKILDLDYHYELIKSLKLINTSEYQSNIDNIYKEKINLLTKTKDITVLIFINEDGLYEIVEEQKQLTHAYKNKLTVLNLSLNY